MSKEVTINGEEYVLKSSIKDMTPAPETKGMKFCIVRTYSAGVFAGHVKSIEGKKVVIVKSRRIWYWDGANSLSDLAIKGTTKPENCKFAAIVANTTVTEGIEIIETTEAAMKNILGVAEWTKK